MDRLADYGYVPMDHRELRFSFKPPRDLVDPDLAIASAQIPRGDRQVLNEAKKHESETRRVWFFLTFPAVSPDGKVLKSCKVDLIIATPQGAMVLKVLDWTGKCETLPGEKWIEYRSDGSKVEHANQLAELDETTQWIRAYLSSKGLEPSTITSYVLFTSPHVKPSFTSDPRVVVGPSACWSLVASNGKDSELAEAKSLTEVGKNLASAVINRVRGASSTNLPPSAPGPLNSWQRFQLCLDEMPQFDLLRLRKNGCFIFGSLEKFEDGANDKPGSAECLKRFCTRSPLKRLRLEHSLSGLVSAPVALVSGGLGWQPMCRVRYDLVGPTVPSKAPTSLIASVDVPPTTRIHFRVYGCEGLVSAEVNDVDCLELARNPRSINTAEDGSTTDMVDHLGQMIGGVLTKSIQAGVKSFLPFPLNTLVQ